MIRVVTYDDFQVDFDPEIQKFIITDEDGVYECEVVCITSDKEHTEEELINGDFVDQDYDYSGEFDEADYDDEDEDFHYKYGYWKITKTIEEF